MASVLLYARLMRVAALIIALSFSGCVTPAASNDDVVPVDRDTDLPGDSSSDTGAGKADGVTTLPNDIHWVRNSAEYQALTRQTYRNAAESLERTLTAEPREAGSWAVILDADETVLDNSTFQKEQLGRRYSASAWRAWIARREAPAVPGAVAFLARVHALGGMVAIVTNRGNADCAATRANLESNQLHADIVLCKASSSNKASRWRQVATGNAADGIGPLDVLMYVGDSITDFPELNQSVRAQGDDGFEAFGDEFIVIPNPMYGSWEQTARQ